MAEAEQQANGGTGVLDGQEEVELVSDLEYGCDEDDNDEEDATCRVCYDIEGTTSGTHKAQDLFFLSLPPLQDLNDNCMIVMVLTPVSVHFQCLGTAGRFLKPLKVK
jgi:hypothetical protein